MFEVKNLFKKKLMDRSSVEADLLSGWNLGEGKNLVQPSCPKDLDAYAGRNFNNLRAQYLFEEEEMMIGWLQKVWVLDVRLFESGLRHQFVLPPQCQIVLTSVYEY
jgi:hypothetical protein